MLEGNYRFKKVGKGLIVNRIHNNIVYGKKVGRNPTNFFHEAAENIVGNQKIKLRNLKK